MSNAVPKTNVSNRLLSLDALRGFDMFWIMGAEEIVHTLFKATGNSFWGGFSDQLSHPAWNGFHFYDLMFSLDCSINKLKVGVGDIPIIHNSPGLRSVTVDWKQGQKYFLEKYNKYANKTLTV